MKLPSSTYGTINHKVKLKICVIEAYRLSKLSVTNMIHFFGIFDAYEFYPKTHDTSLCDTSDTLDTQLAEDKK